jgi:transposase
MSRPPSILVTRTSLSHRELVKIFKKERDGAVVRRLQAILLMMKYEDAEQVAPLCEVDPDTVRRWVKVYNEEGVEGLRKKKAPDAAAS